MLKKIKPLAASIITILLLNSTILAQENPRNNTNIDFEQLAEEAEQDVLKVYEEVDEYNIWVLNHTKRSFEWQFISTILIFFLVVIIVGVGLYFSYLQFRVALKNAEKTSNTELKIGQAGLEISSSVIGLIILLFSLCFFYLYLTVVYPITDSNTARQNILPIGNIEAEEIPTEENESITESEEENNKPE